MENRKEKKIFSPEIRPKNLDVNKRWHVEYYVPAYNGTVLERRREYGKINYKNTFEAKMEEAIRLCNEILEMAGKAKQNILQEALAKITTGKRQRTFKTQRNHLDNFLAWWKKDPKLLNEAAAFEYIRFMTENMKPVTVYNNRSTLSRLYKVCVKGGEIPKNPFEEVKLKKVKGRSQMYYTKTQREALKEWFLKHDPQTWLACQLLYYCFIRPGEEQRFLKIGDIYISQGVIEVRGDIAKNNKTERVVIPTQIKPALAKLCRLYPKHYYLLGPKGVPSPKELGHHTLFKKHRRAILDLGMSDSYSMYSWKHSGAVELLNAGTPIKYIQLQLRHSSLEQTDEYLKNLMVSDWKNLRDAFPTV